MAGQLSGKTGTTTMARRRRMAQLKVIIAFSIIPLFLLILFTYYPFAEMVKFSFYKMRYTGARTFVGFQNYIDLFHRKDIVGSLKLCLYYMAGAVIQVILALYLATILSMKVKAANLWKGLIFFPYLISGIAIGFIFKFFYTRGFVLDTVLQAFGIPLESLPYWLKDKSINNILFIGAIMSVDGTLYEAAALDGASQFQIFRHVILPNIKTIVTLNIILSITGSLSAFEPPYVITNGNNGTGTFFVVMNKVAHTDQKVGLASAMAVFLLIIIILCTIVQKLLFAYVFRDATIDETTNKKKKHVKEAA